MTAILRALFTTGIVAPDRVETAAAIDQHSGVSETWVEVINMMDLKEKKNVITGKR
jgi:hypothetical protein